MTLQEAVKQLDRIVSRPPSFQEKEASFNRSVLREAEGSGDFGHAGRPGQVGGSLPGKGGDTPDKFARKNKMAQELYKKNYRELPKADREKVKEEMRNRGVMRKKHLAPGVKFGLEQQPRGFKVKMAQSLFNKHYNDLDSGEKTQVIAALKARGIIRPQGVESAKEGEKELREAKILSTKNLGGGVNETKLVSLEGGLKAVFKTGDAGSMRSNISSGKEAEREVSAWEVAKVTGYEDIVPPTVFRTIDGEKGSLMKFWDGELARNILGKESYDGNRDLHRAAMFDYVIGNEDRHKGNWLIGNDKMQLIDHGLSFPNKGDFSYGKAGGGNAYDNFMFEVAKREVRGGEKISISELGKPFVENKEKILDALKRTGIESEAIKGVASRIDRIARKDTWKGLFRQ